jgi:hypothetical protein
MMCGLAQLCGPGVGFDTRPQGLDDLIAKKAVAVGQGEQFHEFRGSTEGPTLLRRLATPTRTRNRLSSSMRTSLFAASMAAAPLISAILLHIFTRSGPCTRLGSTRWPW